MKKIQYILENEVHAEEETKDLFADYKNSSSYICDAISERSDSRIDIYTRDLLEWAGNHICDIDEAADELGKPDSFLGYIQQAQFLVFERELYEDLENGVLWAVYKAAEEYAEEITEDQENALDELADSIDNNSRFDEISDGVKEIFEPEELKELFQNISSDCDESEEILDRLRSLETCGEITSDQYDLILKNWEKWIN